MLSSLIEKNENITRSNTKCCWIQCVFNKSKRTVVKWSIYYIKKLSQAGCWTYLSVGIWMFLGMQCCLWLTPGSGWRWTLCLASPWGLSLPLVAASQVTLSPALVGRAPRGVKLFVSAMSLCLPLPSPKPLDMFAVLPLPLTVCQIQCMTLSSVGMFPVKWIA